MIVFEFELDNGDFREIWWLGCTSCTGEDKENSDEIYEQLEAQTCLLTEGF